MVLTYHSLTEGRSFDQVADFDAYLEGRELPSAVRQREERERSKAEFLANAPTMGGEVG